MAYNIIHKIDCADNSNVTPDILPTDNAVEATLAFQFCNLSHM